MTDYYKTASEQILAYLWSELRAAGVLDETDYHVDDFGFSIVPIVPVQDLPQLQNYLGDKTYLIYSIVGLPTNAEQWFIKGEQIVLSVSSPSFSDLSGVTTLIVDALGRQDRSANDINKFATGPFQYHWVEVEYDIAAPALSEGGRMISSVDISYQFARDMTSGRYS